MYILEVWNVTNTQRLAVVGPLLDEGAIEWRLGGDELMECRAAVNDPDAAPLLADGAVLRLQRAGVAADFSLWRLVEREFSDDGRMVAVGAYALWMDLAHGRLGQEMAGGRVLYEFGLLGLTPLRWLSDLILPASRSQALTFAVGVMEATAPVESLSFSRGTSPLVGERMLEAATRYEMQPQYSADGRTCHIDFLARIGRANGAAIRTAKNVASISMREDLRVTTRILAFGAGQLSLADATWTVATATGPAGARVVTFAGMHPVFEDGAFAGVSGPMWFYIPGKGPFPISASAKAAGTLTLTGAATVAPGDVGYIATTAAGRRLDYLESPSAVTKHGVRFGEDLVADDIPDARNIIPNGDLTGVYVGGLPPGWAKVGNPTTTETTDLRFASVGGQAVRVQATAADQGVRSPAGAIEADPLKPYHGALAGIVLISGQVRMVFRHSNGTAYPIDAQVIGTGLNVPFELKREPLHVQPLPVGTGQVDVVSHGGPAEFYLNYVMVSPQVGAEVQPFIAGQAAHVLWNRAAEKLADDSQPKREVNVNVVDLFAVDPAAFPFDQIGRGDTVRLSAAGFPEMDLRVVQMTTPIWGSTRPLALTLAQNARSRPAQDVDALLPDYGPSRPGGAPSPPQATVVAITSVQADFDATLGQLYLRVVGNALVSTLRLFTKTSRAAAWPAQPTATINGRQGTFPAVSVPTGQALFYRIEALDSTGSVGDYREDVYSRVDGAPPVALPRRTLNAIRTAADVAVAFESRTAEPVQLRLRDSEAANATVWVAVTEAGGVPTMTARAFVPGVEEALPAQWFRDAGGTGPNTARKLQGIPLLRDQVSRIHIQAEGRDSALRSDWIPVTLEVREQPWLESASLVWDEAAGKLRGTAVGGGFTQSVRMEIDDDPNFGSPLQLDQAGDQALADGGRAEVTASLPVGGRGVVWYLRAIPHNGPLTAGAVSGAPGGAARDSVLVPQVGAPPGLTVKATPGLTQYTIQWSGDAVTLSTDGGTYAAPPASPFQVPRAAGGTAGTTLTFRGSRDGVEITNTITIPALDKDTVTPDLTVEVLETNRDYQVFRATSSHPGGGAAPGVVVTYLGCTTPSATPSGTNLGAGPTDIRFDAPAYMAAPGSVTFAAAIPGGGSETISRTIPARPAGALAPMLDVGDFEVIDNGTKERWTFGANLGVGGIGPTQVRVENASGGTVADWANAPVVLTFNRIAGGIQHFRARVRDSSAPPVEGQPVPFFINRLLAEADYGPGGEVVRISPPGGGGGGPIGGDEIVVMQSLVTTTLEGVGDLGAGGSGALKAHVVKLNNGRGFPVGTVLGTAALLHQALIEFVPPLQRPVRIQYAGGGRHFVAAWAGVDQCFDLGIDNATASGGNFRALVRQLTGGLVPRTLVPSSGIAANPHGQAYNDRYDYRYTVTLPSSGSAGSNLVVGLYTRLPAGVWTKSDEKYYDNFSGSNITFSQSVEVPRDGMGAGAEFRIVLELVHYDTATPPSATLNEVRFQEGTAASSTSLTPPGSEPVIVQFIAD